MFTKEVAGYVAGVLFVLAFVPYIRAILRQETRPSKASWIIWALLDGITLAGMWSANTLNAQIVGAVIGASTVAVLSLKYGTAGWTNLDRFCLAGAAVGLLMWWAFGTPVAGIICSVSIVVMAAFPTFKTAYLEPEKENRIAWTIYWLSCVFALIAIPQWTFADATQPVGFMLIESMMMILLWRPRR